MKKVIILVFMIMLVIPFAVQAEETLLKGVETTSFYQAGNYFGEEGNVNLSADFSKEKKELYDGMTEMEEVIHISDPTVRLSEYSTIIREIINENPDLFYVSPMYYYYYMEEEENPVVVAIEPIYTMGKKEADERLDLMNREVQHIIDVCIDDSMSDYDKILEIHDYFCVNYEYDTTYQKHSADFMLVEKKGVCEAYALAYKYVLSKLGINCDYASSEAMNHMWNMVEYDSEWFHVDITWDDPVPNVKGRACHKHFMVDDETFEKEGHYGWNSNHKAENKTYADSPLRKIESAVYKKNGKYYHLDAMGNLCCSNSICDGNCEKKYQNKSKYYIADKAGYYFTKMSYLVEEGNCFYFTEADGVYKFDYSDENANPVRIFASKGDKYPVELIINNGRLLFKTATPYMDGLSYGQSMTYSVEHDGFFGDVDDDGEVSMIDAVSIASSTVQGWTLSQKGYNLGDVDNNNSVDMLDAIKVVLNTVGEEF